MARKKLTAQQKYLLKMQGPRPRQAPKAPKSAPKPVYKKPKGPGNPPGFGKTPPKAPPSKHGYGTTTFRVKNATYAKYGESMGVIKHTINKNPLVAKRRRKISREIFDAMNPDGPINPTRRGTRLANKALRTPTERALARATARATAGVAIGGALLAYDAYKALDAYSKTSGPAKQMAKYKSKGGFSHMTSNPKKRGKQGLDF